MRGRFTARRGFTLAEMIVVTFVLLLIAACILPHVAAYLTVRSEKDLEGAIARMPAIARNDAVQQQVPVDLIIQGNELVIQTDPPQNIQQVNNTQQQVNTTIQTLQQLDLGNTLQVASAQTGGQPADPGTWKWTVYPDGTASDAGIEFSEGRATKALVLQSDGDSRWVSGALPDQTPTQWTAGQLDQENQTAVSAAQ